MAMTGIFEALRWRDAKHSYAQAGEDLVIEFISNAMGIEQISYLDVGAHHPVYLSNSYAFYKRGHRGVLVEPDPFLNSELKRVRPMDTCIEAGVGVMAEAHAKFFVMNTKTLNTFSEAEAHRYEAMGGHKIERVLDVPMVTLSEILAERFPQGDPTFVSIDVEGLDYEVVSTLDFSKHRPPIVCVETLRYSEDRKETKDSRIAEKMVSNGYFVYADTYINTIFVEQERWRRGAAG